MLIINLGLCFLSLNFINFFKAVIKDAINTCGQDILLNIMLLNYGDITKIQRG